MPAKRMLGQFALWVGLLVVLTACASGGDAPERTPLPTSTPAPTRPVVTGPDGIQMTAMPPPPAFREASAVLSVDTVASAQLIGRLDPPGEPSSIFAHTFSPDGTQLAALDSNRMMMWDLITGERIFDANRQDMAFYYFSPDKEEINGIDLSGLVRVYETRNAQALESYTGHPAFTGAHAFDDLGGLLALGGRDGTVKVWDTLERVSLLTFDAHSLSINVMAFSPDRRLLATGAEDGTIRIWDWRTRTQLGEIDLAGLSLVDLAFDPDNTRLAVATSENISLWAVTGVDEPDFEYTLLTGLGGTTDVLTFSPDGRFLVNGGNVPAMNVWDGDTGELLALLPNVGGDRVSATFAPESNLLLTAVLDGAVQLWNLDQIDREAGTIAGASLNVPSNRIIDVAWSPDAFQMFFFDASGPVFVWGVPPEALPADDA